MIEKISSKKICNRLCITLVFTSTLLSGISVSGCKNINFSKESASNLKGKNDGADPGGSSPEIDLLGSFQEQIMSFHKAKFAAWLRSNALETQPEIITPGKDDAEFEKFVTDNIDFMLNPDSSMFFAEHYGREVSVTGQDPGWKIHISARPNSALAISKVVIPYLISANVHFKIIPTLPIFRGFVFNATGSITDAGQKGKFITIYPISFQQSKEIAENLDKQLSVAIANHSLNPVLDFESIPGDASLGNSGGIYTRFGIFADTDGKPSFFDDRTKPFSVEVAERIINPFDTISFTWKHGEDRLDFEGTRAFILHADAQKLKEIKLQKEREALEKAQKKPLVLTMPNRGKKTAPPPARP